MASFTRKVNGSDKVFYAIPSYKLVKETSKEVEISVKDKEERKAKVLARMKVAIKIYIKGLSASTLGAEPSEVGLDEVIRILSSTAILFQLSVPEECIKFQVSKRSARAGFGSLFCFVE